MALDKITKEKVDYTKVEDTINIRSYHHNLLVDQINTNETSASTNTSDISGIVAGTKETTTNLGAAEDNVSAAEYGDGIWHKTVLTLSDLTFGAIVGGTDLALGKKFYTLPDGALIVRSAYMSVDLDESDGNITTDTPDVGVGTTIGTGAVTVLGGTAGFENVITGQTAADCNGTATVKTVADQVLVIESAGDHALYLNIADGWTAGGEAALKASGTIVLEWMFVA